MVQKRKKIYFSVISLTGAHIFTKIKNTDGSKKKKKIYFSVISFQGFLIFPIWAFSENVQCFVRAFL